MTVRRKRFAGDRSGNFAILGALLAVPLVLSAGVALDVATISRTKTELQQALDAAVLAVAREGKEINDQQAIQIASTFIENNYHLKFTDMKVVHEGSAVRLDASTLAPIAFGGLFGYDDWKVETSSAADIAYVSYEIALVLDTTGSMAGGKLTALKDAVDGMVESMSVQVKDKDKLKFALVPFASFVNVGPEHGPKFDAKGKQIAGTGAPWLDLKGESPIPQTELGTGASRFQLYQNVGKSWPGCVETRPGEYGVTDAPADPSNPETLFVPAFGIDEPGSAGYVNNYIHPRIEVDPTDRSTKAQVLKWWKYGVEADRNGNPKNGGLLSNLVGLIGLGGDGDDDDGKSKKAKQAKVRIDDGPSGYQGYDKGPAFGCATQPITPLTNDYTLVRNKVKQFKAQGNTNIMEGVAWGTRVLTPDEPFAGASDPKEKDFEKTMVVLTDGANTFGNTATPLGSHYSSFGYLVDGRLGMAAGSSSVTNLAMNERTLAACKYAKDYGITVYTIRLEEPDVKTGTMLKECASSPDHYFDAPSRSQLDEVFKTIKDRIVRLRLSS